MNYSTILLYSTKWEFPEMGVPENGLFIMEIPDLKWMIWGYKHRT